MEIKKAVVALTALSHQTRLSVYRLLVRAGPQGLPAGDIAAAVKMLPNTLSTHLSQLESAKLIKSQRQGRSIIYTADYSQMGKLLGFLVEDCCNGAPEICTPLGLNACAPGCSPTKTPRKKKAT